MIKGKPFVKWAGGKRQIIDKLKQYIPEEFNTYYEPFVGGGALLFELSPKNANCSSHSPQSNTGSKLGLNLFTYKSSSNFLERHLRFPPLPPSIVYPNIPIA